MPQLNIAILQHVNYLIKDFEVQFYGALVQIVESLWDSPQIVQSIWMAA